MGLEPDPGGLTSGLGERDSDQIHRTSKLKTHLGKQCIHFVTLSFAGIASRFAYVTPAKWLT